MTYKFENHDPGLNSPARDTFPITPSDSVDIDGGARSIITDGTGDVSVETVDGNTRVIPSALLLAGVPYFIQITRVNSTGTTAGVVWGFI